MSGEDLSHIMRRLRFRAWHRGTKEADLMLGGFFDRYADGLSAEQAVWLERLLNEEDVDIMAWVIGSAPVPPAYQGDMMERMQRLDYIPVDR